MIQRCVFCPLIGRTRRRGAIRCICTRGTTCRRRGSSAGLREPRLHPRFRTRSAARPCSGQIPTCARPRNTRTATCLASNRYRPWRWCSSVVEFGSYAKKYGWFGVGGPIGCRLVSPLCIYWGPSESFRGLISSSTLPTYFGGSCSANHRCGHSTGSVPAGRGWLLRT